MKLQPSAELARIETVEATPKLPTTEPAPSVVAQPEPVVTANCNPETQWTRADNGQCKDKPVAAPAPTPAPVASVAPSYGSGDCASELRKYDWNHSVAHAVMFKESSGNAGNVNDNPSTGDYSVGCFQVNIYGANAASRPSEDWLKNAANNVSYAYKIYAGNGHSFRGQWGACRYVSCY